jgi:PBP1b-binding outer membrane lipoprotein LpoB
MKAVFPSCVLAIATLLTGCATAPAPVSAPAPAAAEGVQPVAQNDTITGSRIPARRSEKMVSAIGAKDYKENGQSLMAPLKAY